MILLPFLSPLSRRKGAGVRETQLPDKVPAALSLTLFQRQRRHRLGVSPGAQTPDRRGNK